MEMKSLRSAVTLALLASSLSVYSADRKQNIDANKINCERISSLKKLELLVCIKKSQFSFNKVDARTMSQVKSVLNIKQSDTNLDLVNAKYVALHHELNKMGFYDNLNIEGDLGNNDAEKNSLGNLANTTINSSQHIRLSSLIQNRRNIDDLPKALGKALAAIAKNKARFNGNPGRLHIHVDTRELGDYSKDLSTLAIELAKAGTTIWLAPHSVTPSLSMQEMAEVSHYVATQVEKNKHADHARPIKFSKVQIKSDWKSIVKAPLKNSREFNFRYDRTKDRAFYIQKTSKTKTLKNAKEANVNIDDILLEHKIYQLFGHLLENGAYLHIHFPKRNEKNFSDREYASLYNLYSAIGVLGKDETFNFYEVKKSQTTLYFPALKTIEERLRMLNPRYKKPHLSNKFYEQYLNCHIELRDDDMRVSHSCKVLKQDGKILD